MDISFFSWDVSTILFFILLICIFVVSFYRLFIFNEKKQQIPLKQKIINSVRYLLFLKFYKSDTDDNKPTIFRWARSFYPVILLVFVIRSFFIEPFQIPSNSMMPTLLTGDFILVNKFLYGLRLPVTNTKLFEISDPKRGDIMVFRYPNFEKDANKQGDDYIKRVIGLAGDNITYINDRLYVNNKLIVRNFDKYYQGIESGIAMTGFLQYSEKMPNNKYKILVSPSGSKSFSGVVPEGYYFVMGDNRSRSADSRFWGFVPKKLVIGKAFFIWFSFDKSIKLSRLGVIN